MATNIVYEPGYKLSVVVTDPAAPVTNDPVRYGALTGVALTDEGEGGNDATHTSVDFGPFIGEFSVFDELTTGIAIGDPLFYDNVQGQLDNDPVNGYFFGIALAVVVANATTVIQVMHVTTPGAGAYAALGVTTAKLAAGAVTEPKVSPASLTGLVAKVVASGNVIGGIPVVHHILMVAGANGDTDITLTHKTRILDVWVHPRTSVASSVVTVKNVANGMSDAMVAAVAGVVTRCASLAVAYDTVAAGTVLRATGSGGATQPDCDVYVLGERVA